MVFVRRSLESEARTLGERLRLLRRTQAVTMDMLVAATRIQRRYLEALEWGRYYELPDPLYTRNFIRAYARYLGADEEYFLELFALEVARSDLLAPHRLPRTRLRSMVFFPFSYIVTFVVFALLLVGGLFLMYTKIAVVFRPPNVALSHPAQEEIVHTPYYLVEGEVVERDIVVTINDHQVPLSEDGKFSGEVSLSIGPNVISVHARSRYSQEKNIERVVVYEPPRVDK